MPIKHEKSAFPRYFIYAELWLSGPFIDNLLGEKRAISVEITPRITTHTILQLGPLGSFVLRSTSRMVISS